MQLTFGELIKQKRKELGFSLKEVATNINLDQSTLSKIEKNERNIGLEYITKLSKILKINKKVLNDYYYSNKIIDELKSYSEYEDVLNLVKSKLAKKGVKGDDLTSIDWTEKKLSKPKVTVRIGTMFSGIGAIEYALKRLNIKII
jgi:DNA (cytosine-5)-methyltransferase 1